jgi:hypothetical protein
MKVGFLVVIVALVATVALPLSSRANTQPQKQGAQAVPKPTPTPSSTSANSTKTSDSSFGEDADQWVNRSIKSVSDARRFFEAMGCSHFHMMRDYPDRYSEYRALKINDAQEHEWRRDAITKLSDRLLNPATEAKDLWHLYTRMETMCEDQGDAESVLKIYKVTQWIASRLPVGDGLIVAEAINGTRTYYEAGPIYLAVKHGLRDVAQDLSDYSISLAQRAKSSKVDAEGAELAIRKCLAVKRHFRLR